MSCFNDLGARHQQLIGAVIKNLEHTQVDWEQVAKDAEFSSAKYARDEYKKAREKLGGTTKKGKGGSDDAAGGTPATKPKKTPASRKRKAADEDDAEEATPSKRSKTPKAKKADTPVSEDDDKKVNGDAQVKAEPAGGDDDDYL
ncbi:hypothetical protein CKM354_000477100 [Cercospora kikuchii]|uniref:Uncharacterized protein n=1 Tax=Cercospora kikuchii TaxID=84275 RepID=A0A9P3CET0_9PEZI|nr:uncharacterized protein CKM354_000477100 [Cercospora kikuchii]GIZ41468.1 hypothetical protein CKM354_000477100 [Cercospora kikuchii]